MAKNKRTVTIEFDRVKITTRFPGAVLQRCELCQAESEFIENMDVIELAKIMQLQGLEIACDELHFYHPTEMKRLVCVNSLINGSRKDDARQG
jgi:hypothetical protein